MANNANSIINRFRMMTKDSKWNLINTISIKFDTFHPQGLIVQNNKIYFSTVNKIEP